MWVILAAPSYGTAARVCTPTPAGHRQPEELSRSGGATLVGGEDCSDRNPDHMVDPLLGRRRGKIEQYRLEQRRLAGIEELRRRDLAILDREHAGLDLGRQIGL